MSPREWRQGLLENFGCRRCGAGAGEDCRTPGGRDARHTHQLRIDDWMEWRMALRSLRTAKGDQ